MADSANRKIARAIGTYYGTHDGEGGCAVRVIYLILGGLSVALIWVILHLILSR